MREFFKNIFFPVWEIKIVNERNTKEYFTFFRGTAWEAIKFLGKRKAELESLNNEEFILKSINKLK